MLKEVREDIIPSRRLCCFCRRRNEQMNYEDSTRNSSLLFSNNNDVQNIIALVNLKSGSTKSQNSKFIDTIRAELKDSINAPSVFDLVKDKGATRAFCMYNNPKGLVVLACGGDGTVSWVLNEIDRCFDSRLSSLPLLAILPLGTGNDMSRFINRGSKCGSNFGSKYIKNISENIKYGTRINLDRWHLKMVAESESNDFYFYSYFSVGVDADVALDFHKARNADPNRFHNRASNMIIYGKISVNKLFDKKYFGRSIGQHLQLKVDDLKIDNIKQLDGLLFLNIETFAAGTKPWLGKHIWSKVYKPDCKAFSPQRCNDGKLEIIGFKHYQLAQMRWGMPGKRIAQGSNIELQVDCESAFQIDGEPSAIHAPCTIYINRKSQANVIQLKFNV